MSTDVETRLRAAFHAAEQVITVDGSAPELLGRPARHPHGRGALWALGAAAAAVVAVAGLAIGLRSDRSTPPSTSTTSTPPTSSTTSSPVVKTGLQAKSCDVREPVTWQRVINAARVPGYLTLRAADDQGNAYAVQILGTTNRLVQIDADKNVVPVYIAPGGSRISAVVVDRGWAVITLIYGGNPNSHGGEGQGSPTGIVAIQIGMNESDAITVRPGSANDTSIVQPPVVSRGVIYWAEGDAAGNGERHAFTIATRKDRTLAHGTVLWPFMAGGGVYWSNGKTTITQRAGNFPPGYGAVQARGRELQSGGRYVWQQTVDANWVLRMSDGGPAPVTVVRPEDGDSNLTPDALSGHFLFYDDGSRMSVLDTTTGAAALLPASVYDQVQAGGPQIALQTRAGVISMVRTADLPGLHC